MPTLTTTIPGYAIDSTQKGEVLLIWVKASVPQAMATAINDWVIRYAPAANISGSHNWCRAVI
jgi:hypothetical protein